MKKFSWLLMMSLVLTLLTAISGYSEKKIRIGLSFGTLQEERWNIDKNFFVQQAEKDGAVVDVVAANADENLQNSQCENLITKGIDVLVVIAQNGETAATIVDAAHKANVKVVAYDRMIKNCDLDYYVSFDSVKVGELMADYVCKIKPKGTYFVIDGSPTDNNASLVRQGFGNILKKYPDAKVVFEQWCDSWSPEKALKFVENGLTQFNNKVDVVLCANDGTCGGAVQALAEQKLDGKVLTTGQDADLAACKRVIAGTQSVTIYKPIKKLALAAEKVAIEIGKGMNVSDVNAKVKNGKIDVPSVMLVPIQVDKKNMKAIIVADGFHTEAELYK
jgi:D-xylose transport system substrate-binding protein